jgi:hypothetical protein
MTDIKALKDLAKYAVRKQVPTNFENIASLEDVEDTLREACRELAPDIYSYERNKTYIFQIIQTAIDEVLPKQVLATIGQFAEVQQFGNQEIARFKIKSGRNRAKKFVTRAAVEGIYETFRMDHRYIDVTCNAYGGAAAIDFERYLSGDEDFAEYTAIMMEGLEDAVYKEIWGALTSAAKSLQAVDGGNGSNYAEITGDGDVFTSEEAATILKLVTTAKRYGAGTGATIWGTEPLLQKFTNATGGSYVPNIPLSDLDEIKDRGLIGKWKGNGLVELPNSFEDETNSTTVFEDCYGFVFPNGRDTKVVKVALEGQTVVDDFKNKDRSMEIQAYKKFGVAIITYNDWCMFKVTSLAA